VGQRLRMRSNGLHDIWEEAASRNDPLLWLCWPGGGPLEAHHRHDSHSGLLRAVRQRHRRFHCLSWPAHFFIQAERQSGPAIIDLRNVRLCRLSNGFIEALKAFPPESGE
jgi:hypothetical protein